MKSALAPYFGKRDFKVTSEPQGGKASTGALSFVIQKHAASRLHYDFRLELDGTLKSWAVPKGPSLDPGDKRMAVHVEDHPIDYGGFEGTIPKGQYGAGEVIVWDNGTWEPVGDPRAGYRAGKLKFRLDGKKLHGGWTLVRMHGREGERQEPWLLIKEKDEAARPSAEYSVVDAEPKSVLSDRTIADKPAAAPKEAARDDSRASSSAAKKPAGKRATKSAAAKTTAARSATARSTTVEPLALPAGATKAKLPATLSPQLATLVSETPSDDGWIYEIKFDGYRIVARVDGDDVRLLTRRGNDWSARMPGLVEAVRSLGLGSGWLDGEIVVNGANGTPDFNALQNAFDSARTERHPVLRLRPAVLRRPRPAQRAAGRAACGARRRARPRAAAAARPLQPGLRLEPEGAAPERVPDAPRGDDRQARRLALRVAAQPDLDQAEVHAAPGVRGRRLDRSAGLAHRHRLAPARHPRRGRAPALRRRRRQRLRPEDASLVKQALAAIPAETTPFFEKPRDVRGHWVEPKLVAEVSFGEWTPDGRIRHSVFHGLREDKDAKAIGRERPIEPSSAATRSRGSDSAQDDEDASGSEESDDEEAGDEGRPRPPDRRRAAPRRRSAARRPARKAAAMPPSRASASATPIASSTPRPASPRSTSSTTTSTSRG
jgi:bifunctional non-homologous end joining protein LigD